MRCWRRSIAASSSSWRTSRTNAPIARPSSSGRPGPSPCQQRKARQREASSTSPSQPSVAPSAPPPRGRGGAAVAFGKPKGKTMGRTSQGAQQQQGGPEDDALPSPTLVESGTQQRGDRDDRKDQQVGPRGGVGDRDQRQREADRDDRDPRREVRGSNARSRLVCV